jgi:hypothetical protein
MIATAHLAAGAVAGMACARLTARPLPRILAAFFIGVLTHVALDAIPHGDYEPLSRRLAAIVAIGESVLACVVIALITRPRLRPGWPAYLLPGIFGGALPDMKAGGMLFLPESLAYTVRQIGDGFHDWFHAPPPITPAVGWATEIVTALILLFLLSRFPLREPRA